MDIKQNKIVALNNFCEHSHKIKSEEENLKNCFCETTNGNLSIKGVHILKSEELSFKE